MPVDVIDLVGHSVAYYCAEKSEYDGTYQAKVVLDNEIVIEHIYLGNLGCDSAYEVVRILRDAGSKILTASQSQYDSAFTLVFGKGVDGSWFKVRVFPEMLRRCCYG